MFRVGNIAVIMALMDRGGGLRRGEGTPAEVSRSLGMTLDVSRKRTEMG